MKPKKAARNIFAVLIALLFLLVPITASSFTSDTGSVTITMRHGTAAISGFGLSLYRVADIAERDGGYYYVLTPEFAASGVSLAALTKDGKIELDTDLNITLSKTFHAYALANGTVHTERTTDTQGRAGFAPLGVGLYLLSETDASRERYLMDPFLVNMPLGSTEESEPWIYDINIEPKSEVRPVHDGTVKVTKVWLPEGLTHPSSVQAQLYRNGEAYGEPVTLNAANGWTYTWTGLDRSWSWSVDEPNVPEGYTKTVKAERNIELMTATGGNDYTITNTLRDLPTPTPVPDGGVIAVKKVWFPAVAVHPAGVAVQLYRNGEAYGEPVTLNAANGWSHKWYGLDMGWAWSVDEPNVPEGYTKTVKAERNMELMSAETLTATGGNDYTVTNTLKSGAEPLPFVPNPTPTPAPDRPSGDRPSDGRPPDVPDAPEPNAPKPDGTADEADGTGPNKPDKPEGGRPDEGSVLTGNERDGENMTVISGGTDYDDGGRPNMPPAPANPKHYLELQDDGSYILYDEDGTPLGRWVYDPEEDIWIFEEEPTPLSNVDGPEAETEIKRLPQTGQLLWPVPVMAVGGVAILIAGAVILITGKKSKA